jgi:hypothetical protein
MVCGDALLKDNREGRTSRSWSSRESRVNHDFFYIIQPDRYREFELLAGRTTEELQWIARKLKEVLDIPTPKPMTFFQWVRQDSPQ